MIKQLVDENYISEDFGIGVGGALGLTQGIPNSCDGSGVYATPIGKQPKKKRKKKKHKPPKFKDYILKVLSNEPRF